MPPEGSTNALDTSRYLEFVAAVENERQRQLDLVITHLPDWRASVQGTLAAETERTVETDRRVQGMIRRVIKTWRDQHDSLLNSIERNYRQSLLILQTQRLGGIMDEVHRSENKSVVLSVDEMAQLLVPASRRSPKMEMSLEHLAHPSPYAFIEIEGESLPGKKRLRWIEILQVSVPVTLRWHKYTDELRVTLRQDKGTAVTIPLGRLRTDLPIFSAPHPVQELNVPTGLLGDDNQALLDLIPQTQRRGLEGLRYDEDKKSHDVDLQLPGVHVGTGDQRVWRPLTDVRAYFLKTELAKQLPVHAAVA